MKKHFYASLQSSASEDSNAHAHDEKHKQFLGVSLVCLIKHFRVLKTACAFYRKGLGLAFMLLNASAGLMKPANAF